MNMKYMMIEKKYLRLNLENIKISFDNIIQYGFENDQFGYLSTYLKYKFEIL